MSTGWKYITSDGKEFKNQLLVKKALIENPSLKIYFHELTMAGSKETDVTEQFQNAIDKTNTELSNDED